MRLPVERNFGERKLVRRKGWAFALPNLLLAGSLALGSCLIAPPARAQLDSREAIELQHQLAELRREVQTLREQSGKGGSTSGGSLLGGGRGSSEPSSGGSEITVQLLQRVENLEEQVRRLRGRIDEVANQTQRQGDDLAKQIGDLGFRVQGIEQGGGAPGKPPAPLAAGPAAAGPAGAGQASVPAKRTPELAMQEGNAALARRDYVAAEAAARDVLANNKTSPRAYDAQFLLAQALSGRKEYSQSAIAYDDAYKRNRKGSHSQDSLLGLANSLTAIGERRAACDTLGQLRGEYPTPRADLKDAIAGARQRAGCR